MPKPTERVEVQSVNGGAPNRIARDKYEAMKQAILQIVPKDEHGFPFKDLPAAVAPLLPSALFESPSISWYTTSVKLDLERLGVRPQRLRRLK